MKPSNENPDDLYSEAGAIPHFTNQTLESPVAKAPQREIVIGEELQPDAPYGLNEFGFPVLNSCRIGEVTSLQIYELLETEGDEMYSVGDSAPVTCHTFL